MPRKATIRLEVSADSIDMESGQQALAQASQVLQAGGTVAFPTETVYGLGANALDIPAVEGIFAAKQRPSWDPLIVHISDLDMLSRVTTNISSRAEKLMEAFWPGPLTLLLPKLDSIPDIVTAARSLVGVRMPAHPVARALIAAAGVPVAAPSANRFGHTSATTAQHVLDDLDGRIDLVLDGGPAWCGVESSVVEVGAEAVTLYRPGAVSIEQIAAVGGPVVVYRPPTVERHASPESLPSPGVGIRHYAPRAVVYPVEVGAEPERQQRWLSALDRYSAETECAGVMLPVDWSVPPNFSGVVYPWGIWENDRALAQRLFAGLRALDEMGATAIICPLPPDVGLGAALRDRLLKAARSR